MKQSTSFAQVATNLLNVLQGYTKTIRLLLVIFLTLTVTTNAWGETKSITLTQSALGLTGSYTTNTEKTIGGVTFMYSNLMKNNDNIQAQATGGEIYNSTAIPGNIVSVAVTHSGTARSSTIYFGTSAKATTESSTFSGTKTIEPTSDYQYFYIKRGSNAAYWTQIVITYETDGDDSGDTSCLTLSATSNYPFNSTSSSNTSVYSTSIDGITFENKGGYKYNSYLSFNRSLSGAYIANTTPFNGNIESIVVDYSSGGSSYFNMYEGSASKPSSTVVSPSKTGTGSVTYTFSGNNPYFKLALKTTGDYCNINSITICYSNTAAPSYTVTATSNNNDYGTVSVSGTTITASPNDGYRVSTATPYTISPNNSATVRQDGNTFNVTPTANCTININFEAIPTHKVYFNTGGLNEITPVSVAEGSTYNIIQTPTGLTDECEYNTFAGWTRSSTTLNNANECPEIVTSITMSTSDITLYAVYQRTEDGGGNSTPTSVTKVFSGANNADLKFTTGSSNHLVNNTGYTAGDANVKFTTGTNSNNSYYDGSVVRFYAGSSMIITPLNGVTITRIEIVRSTSSSNNSGTISTDDLTASNSNSTTNTNVFTGSSTTAVTFKNSAQCRFTALNITYTTSGGSSSTTYYHSTPECTAKPSVYTITYDANGGEGTIIDNTEYTNGTTVTVKGNFGNFTKNGYAFTGWNTQADGNGESYKHDDKFDITANTTLYAQWCKAYWKLVTDAAELENDTRIVIAAKDYNFALSTTQNDANRGQAAITKKYNTITIGDDVQTLSVVGTVHNNFALYSPGPLSIGYLYAASNSANQLKTKTIPDNNDCYWSIGISETVASIYAQGDNSHDQIKYNHQQSGQLFSCYESSNTTMSAVVIYKEVCVQDQFKVTSNLKNATANTNPTTVDADATSLTLNYSANTGYLLPETITVKMGGVELLSGTDYTWNKETGEVWIVLADGFTGDIVVTINGWQQLAAPTELNVTNITSTSATLSWDEVKNAKNYAIIIKKGDKVKYVTTGGTTCNVTELDANTEYTGCVYAVADGYTNSEETCVTFTTAPAAEVVNWNVKGTEHQTNFNGQSTAIYQPTDEELTCGEKKFVGWTATEDYENATDAPNDLFTTTLPDGVTEGTTFYAVYADTRTTTSITYTWDMVKQSTTPALAAGDQIVITAKNANYALSTTQNTYNRGAVEITKNSNSITINNNVQIFTIENGNEENTFALATGNGYLSGTRRKAGRNYYEQLNTATSKASANASWYIGFTEETTPHIYNEVSEKNGRNYEYPNYYVGFNYDYDWWESEYTYYFEAVRDASTWYDYNPENISIYRKTQHTTTTTVNSGYTTDCGCIPPQTPLNIENSTVVVNETLDLATIRFTGGTGGRISQYYCSDATYTTIAEGHIFSANALGTYEITATQEANNGACETTATFTVTVTCATPSITPPTYETTINTPVDLKSIITSTSTMPLSFAYTGENVYISGTNFTFLAAGTYTITATQVAGGIYCNGSQEITITVTDPCAGKTKPSVTATANETTITVVWDALDDVTTYRVYNNTTGDSDETTETSYTFSGLNPSTEYSWTVEAVYSDGCTAATSGTTTTSKPVVTYTVNWNVAGSGYNTGTPTTSVIHGEKVSALPTAPDPATYACTDKVFVGWSKSQFVDGTRPADLFTTRAGSPAITAATTFYAVFADCVTGGDTPEDDTQGEWTLVTDVNDLQAGDKIIIACYSKEKAASELTSAILSVDADVTFSNSGNTLTPSASTLIVTLGGGTGAWTFANSSGQLLGATAVKKLAWDGGTTTWSISISGIEATISNTNNSYGRFLYNVGSPRFTTYTSSTSESMLLPQIYKKTGSGSGGGETPEPEYTVTLSVLGETSEENTTSNYTLPIDVDAACAGKTFVGWTTTANLSSPTEPISNYWAKGTPVTITEDKTYYAVFAEGTNTFEWVTTGVESGADYLLAGYYGGNDYVLKNTLDSYGYIKTDNINAIDNVITTSDNSLIWTIAGNSTFGYYIYNPASDKYLNIDDPFTLDGTAKTRYSITMSKDADNYVQSYIKYGNDYCYLYYDNTIGINETEASIYLYKRAYSNFFTTCDGGGETPEPETTYTVSFNAGTGTCTTQSLKETSEGVGVTLPTATGCGDWTFAGWATASVTETTTAPTLHAAGNNYKPNSNTTLYAVYSKAESGGGGGGEELSQTLQYDSWSYGGITTDKGTSSPAYRLFHSGSYVQSASFDLSTLTKVVVYGGTFGGDKYSQLTIGDGTNTWKSVTVSGSSQTGVNTYTDGTTLSGMGILRVTSNSGSNSGSGTGVRISKIEIYTTSGGSSTTYYNSNPDCESGGDTGGGSGEGGGVDSNTEVFSDQLNFDANSTLITNRDGWSSLTTAYSHKSGLQSGIRIASGDNAGSITTNPLTKVEGTNATLRVEFDAVGWDSNEKTLSVSATNGTASPTSFNLTNSKGNAAYTASDHYSFTITGASSSTKVTWSAAKDNRAIIANVVITQLSTPASAPARKVAMKRDAAKAAKKAGMARPVLKAPAALAAQECTSYENYTTICCANPITDLKFAAGANSITLYWNTAAASATATLYSDEECTSQVTGATQSGITNGTWTFTGLAKTTTYYAKVTTGDGCTAVLEVSTERPHVSVAEWGANQINIDVNTNEPIVVVLENEVTSGSQTGTQAEKLFFSKYYEATANVKLVAVYNGTPDAINLDDYIIKYGKTSWATNYIPLAEFATTANGFAQQGYLSPGEEMILYTKNVSDDRDVAIMDCVTEAYPDGKWIEVTTTNNTGSGSLSFGGDKVIALFNGGELIDIIGAGNAGAPTISGSSMTKPSWGDAKGWTCDEGLSIDDGTMIGISTNRCLLVRNNTVTSGENAVSQNTSDFVTLCTEWRGAHVPDDDIDDGVSESCENFAFVGTFDYSDYYVKYEELGDPQALDTEGRKEDGTYLITVPTTTYPKGLHDIACTNMRISVKSGDGKTTLVTQDLKVPIIIDQDVQTNNEIYFQYPQRTDVDVKPDLGGDQNENILTPEICADCDVVIRDSKQLTHVAEGVSEFNNMMVYPGAKFDNSTSQEFYLNTLQMQAKNDEVSYAIINNDGSTIDVGDMVFVKRIDDKYWYQFSLPYDCKVSDIIQQDGQSMGKYWVDWGIKYYNGKRRQAEGTAASAGQVSKYWEKVEETATLKAHQGYIIGLFTTEWKNQMKFVYFTPVTTNPYRESGDDAKTTTVNSWYTTPPTTDAPRHHGWNFTGSPYISMFNPQTPPYYGESSVLMSGTFDPDNPDGEYSSGDVYLSIPVLPDGLYYNQVLASSTSLMPFRAYFVQTVDPASADEQHTLTYAKNGRQLSPASAPARAAATKQRVLAELLVTAPDGQTDNTGIWVDERYTTDYEITADLTKMYVAGTKPQLYTIAVDNEKLAYNALPDDAATNVPIELYAPLAGDYTLTLNDRVSRIAGAESIELLHDGQVVANLLIQDYTITANKGTVSGYSLSIRRRADVSTAVDNTTGSTITLIANDEYISLVGVPTDATISIYDMLGRLITSQQANGQSVVNLSIVPQGVYNIVVANGTGYTTIKSVIK